MRTWSFLLIMNHSILFLMKGNLIKKIREASA